ncbi:kinase-like domain-containing protein [Mycena metata]|uniref:Kinase-like domain-containing protein n=1 Tax=Mycena metata TaxID=1033252 RepID=A0AAD7IXK5_9AGAR|nr:kinase-like domain-containing protein [Mycena metata]
MGSDFKAERLAFCQLNNMKCLHLSFPFGEEMSHLVLRRFSKLFHAYIAAKAKDPTRSVPASLEAAHTTYSNLSQLAPINWIEKHELVRSHFIRLLSASKSERYNMSEDQTLRWRGDILNFTRTFVRSLKRDRKALQICIDVLYTMMTVLRDNLTDGISGGMLTKEYSSLVTLCEKYSLVPTSFHCMGSLKQTEQIGVGASATVWRGTLVGKDVAIKSFSLYQKSPPISKIKKKFIRETLILRLVQHPNILRFLNIVDQPGKICIVTPWYINGSIMRYIATVVDAPLKELMEQIADGLHFLSQYHIVHGDLKGDNILIDDDGKALIADFGLSSIRALNLPNHDAKCFPNFKDIDILYAQCSAALEAGGLSTEPDSISSLAATIMSASSGGGGTDRWMAPERLFPRAYKLSTQQATKASDVYGFAMLVFEVFSGGPPWSTKPGLSFLPDVVLGRRPPRPAKMTDELWDIVTKCWAPSPADRPTIWEVYNRLACIP